MNKMVSTKTLILSVICLFWFNAAHAQDTVRVSLQEFIKQGIENSGQIDAERQKTFLAKNNIKQVQDERYIPTFNLRTTHGLIPKADTDTETTGAFLDDLSNLTLSTEANIELIQPIFTWGALQNAVEAARAGAEAALFQFEMKKNETALRLYELYQSYLLSLEVDRLLDEAQNTLNRVISGFEEQQKKEGSDIDQSDLFRLKVFKSEFTIRAAEVKQNAKYVQRIWNYALKADENTVYMPEERFLDPVQNPIKSLPFYKNRALNQRPEILALNAGIDAAKHGLEATKSKNYPALFVGITGTYLHTPNPPLGNYTFRLNENNFATGAIGIGFRQNLDFFGMKYDITESRIQQRQAEFSKQAAIDGIVLQVNEKYKQVSLSKIKVEQTDEALVTSKKWLRQEQLDYDFGMSNTKDLIDAIKKELELKVRYKQEIFNFNQDMAELYKAADLSVTTLTTNYSE